MKCDICRKRGKYVISYNRTSGSLPRSIFCSEHSAELHKQLMPLSNDTIISWSQERILEEAAA